MRNILITILILISSILSAQDTLFIDYGKVSKKNKEMVLGLLKLSYDDLFNSNNFEVYLFDLAVFESNCDWKAYSGDHLGLWQMGTLAREDAFQKSKDIGKGSLHKFNSEKFRNFSPNVFPPSLQKEFMYYYVRSIQDVMYKYIKKYDGTYVNDVYITKSGIIAACHLVGMGNVKKYFDSNGEIISKDGNGVSMEKYMKLFWDYSW